MSFEKEWAKESDAAIKAVEETVKVTAIELFSGVIYRTPVANMDLWKNPKANPDHVGGSARSNWFLTFTTPSTQTTTSTDRENGSRDSFYGEIAREIGNKTSRAYILSNNLSYIERLDNNWSSQTGGLGIVSPEESRVNAMIPRIAKAANKRYGVE